MELTGTYGTSPLAMYDLTIPSQRYNLDQVTTFCRTYCKRWCFQLEQGNNTNYNHYQARISLISKKRNDTMINWISKDYPGFHVTPTSNPTYYTGNEFYVMKIDTRIDGPWSDRTDINITTFPKRLKNTPMWFPWQQTILDIINTEPDDRIVNVILDRKGNQGKTFLTLWLECRNQSIRIPEQKDARDIMRMVMSQPISRCYFIDLPRAVNNQQRISTYAAIEEIKNGYCYDDRYHFKKLLFDPPHIWVFSNTTPDPEQLSKDRWRYWEITDDRRIIPYRITHLTLKITG